MRVIDLKRYGFGKEVIDLLSFPCSPYLQLEDWEVEMLTKIMFKKEWLNFAPGEFSVSPGLEVPKQVPILIYALDRIEQVLNYFVFYTQQDSVVVPIWYHRRYGALKLVLNEKLEVGYRFNEGRFKRILKLEELEFLTISNLYGSLLRFGIIKNHHISSYYITEFCKKVFSILTI